MSLAPDATVAALQQQLEELTGLFVRKQKLMAAGKVVSGRSGTLAAAGIKPGAKLMLLAAAGSQTGGQAALEAARQSRLELLERGRQQVAERAAQKGLPAPAAAGQSAGQPPSAASMRQRADAWAKTGIAALRDLKLVQLPPELLEPGVAASIRVLDAGGNQLGALPPGIAALTALQRLRLSLNQLTDGGMQWQALAAGLTQLLILAVDDNRLTQLPECISSLARLQKLSLSGNQIGEKGRRGGLDLPALPAALQSLHVEELATADLSPPSALLPTCAALQPACRRAWAAWRTCAPWRCAATAWQPCRPPWAAAAS